MRERKLYERIAKLENITPAKVKRIINLYFSYSTEELLNGGDKIKIPIIGSIKKKDLQGKKTVICFNPSKLLIKTIQEDKKDG